MRFAAFFEKTTLPSITTSSCPRVPHRIVGVTPVARASSAWRLTASFRMSRHMKQRLISMYIESSELMLYQALTAVI